MPRRQIRMKRNRINCLFIPEEGANWKKNIKKIKPAKESKVRIWLLKLSFIGSPLIFFYSTLVNPFTKFIL